MDQLRVIKEAIAFGTDQTAGPAYFVGRGAIRQHGKSRGQLAMSQPVVPKAVSDMEHALGVRLLDQREIPSASLNEEHQPLDPAYAVSRSINSRCIRVGFQSLRTAMPSSRWNFGEW